MSSSSSAYDVTSESDDEFCRFDPGSDRSVADYCSEVGSSPEFKYEGISGDFQDTFYQSCSGTPVCSPSGGFQELTFQDSPDGKRLDETSYHSCFNETIISTPDNSSGVRDLVPQRNLPLAFRKIREQSGTILTTPDSDVSFEVISPGEGYQFTKEEMDQLMTIDKKLQELHLLEDTMKGDNANEELETYDNLTNTDLANRIMDIERKLKILDSLSINKVPEPTADVPEPNEQELLDDGNTTTTTTSATTNSIGFPCIGREEAENGVIHEELDVLLSPMGLEQTQHV